MTGLFHAVRNPHNPLGTLARTRGTGRYTFGLALAAGLAGLLYGYDTVAISGAIDFLRAHYGLDAAFEGLVISSVMLGGIAGAVGAGFLADRFGRRRVLMAGAALFLVASLFSAASDTALQLIVARMVGGVGIGLTAALAVTYITESAPTHIRGTLAFSYQLLAVCGIFLANVANYIIAARGTDAWDIATGWRWMLGIGAVPAAVFLMTMWFAPESPRFLIQSGRVDEGFAVLEHVNGTDKARTRVTDVQSSMALERELGASAADLFRPGLRRALIVGVFLAVANQAVGVNVISYYGPVLFKGIGYEGDTGFLAASCVAGVELVATVVGMYLIDAVGRKHLLEAGAALMAVFAACLAVSYSAGSQLWMLVFAMLFTSTFGFSMGPVPWVMLPELFPNHLRGRAVGLCTAFLFLTNWAVGQFTPMLVGSVGGGGTFALFALLDLACLVGVVKLVPETMDRTLEDIEGDWLPRTPEASARVALSTADARIRRAESTLAHVENQRMQALGIIEQAERDRVAAQKRLFSLQNERMRREITRRLDEYRRALRETEERSGSTVHVTQVPGPQADPIDSLVARRLHADSVSPDSDDLVQVTGEGPEHITADMLPLEDLASINEVLANAVRSAAGAGLGAGIGSAGADDATGIGLGSAGAAGLGSSGLAGRAGTAGTGLGAGVHEAGAGTGAGDTRIGAVNVDNFADVNLSELDDLPEADRRKDEAELRRENEALRNVLDSLDQLIRKD